MRSKPGSTATVDYEVVFQALEANPVVSIQWVSGELGISQSRVEYY